MTNVATTISNDVQAAEQAVSHFFQELEHYAVVAWDDFLTGIKWINAEAHKIAAWAKTQSPAVQALAQQVITDAEKSASTLSQYAGTQMGSLIQGVVDGAEQDAASLIQNALGATTPGASFATAAAQAGIQMVGDVVQNAGSIGLAKALAALMGPAA